MNSNGFITKPKDITVDLRNDPKRKRKRQLSKKVVTSIESKQIRSARAKNRGTDLGRKEGKSQIEHAP